MTQFFDDEALNLEHCSDAFETTVRGALLEARQLGSQAISPRHLFLGFFQGEGDIAYNLLAPHLRPGATVVGIADTLRRSFSSPADEVSPIVSLQRSSFSSASLKAFEVLESLMESTSLDDGEIAPMKLKDIGWEHVLWAILKSMEASDIRLLRYQLPVNAALEALHAHITTGLVEDETQPPLSPPIEIFAEDEMLDANVIESRAWEVLTAALQVAETGGRTSVGCPDLLHGLLSISNGVLATAIRVVHPTVSPSTIFEITKRMTGGEIGDRQSSLSLTKSHFHPLALKVLEHSAEISRKRGLAQVDEAALTNALLSNPDGLSRRLLTGAPLNLNLNRLSQWVDKEYDTHAEKLIGLRVLTPFPEQICNSSDLTAQVKSEAFKPLVGRAVELRRIEQTLYRKENGNVIIVGERGTGRTALVHGFADLVSNRQIDFLRDKRLINIDPDSLAGEDLHHKLEQIFQIMEHETNIILVFDGIDRILSNTSELFLKALQANAFNIIAVTTPDGYLDTFAANDDLNGCFLRLEVKEPSWQDTVEILNNLHDGLQEEYGVKINNDAIRAAAKYSAECILSQRLPKKAVDILKAACDEARYRSRSTLTTDELPQPKSNDQDKETRVEETILVSDGDVVTAIAKRTDIPESVIAHTGGEESGFADRLRRIVIGQDYAVDSVAERMELIQKGVIPKNKPAAVFMFVGETGAGKTELAKAIAQVYSHTGKLIHYQMSNFREEHSVSGLIGSPPGFKGYDEGGDLVNKLNADPFSVILFDEFEKASPEVHDVLLELCDQAMITDRRGITARANKAFIVMTSNEEKGFIVKEMDKGVLPEEIARSWRSKVGKARVVKIREEMLNRIDVVAPFGPLKSKDFEELTRLQFARISKEFLEDYDIELLLEEAACKRLSYLAERAGESGRAVARHIMRFIHGPAVDMVVPARDKGARRITFYLDSDKNDVLPRLTFEREGIDDEIE